METIAEPNFVYATTQFLSSVRFSLRPFKPVRTFVKTPADDAVTTRALRVEIAAARANWLCGGA